MGLIAYQYNFKPNELCHLMEVEDFTTNSVVTVQAGQQAVLIKDGVALGNPMLEGRHTLQTTIHDDVKQKDIQIYGASSFHCKIYFLNTDTDVTLNWGTAGPNGAFSITDPQTGYTTRAGASGSLSLAVDDPIVFIIKTIGQMSAREGNVSFTKFDIQGFLSGKLQEKIKTIMAKVIRGNNIPVFDLEMHYMDISDAIREQINSDREFKNYGFTLKNFSVTNITIPDEELKNIMDVRNRMIRAQTAQSEKLASGEADLYLKRKAEDDSLSVTEAHAAAYQQQTQREVLKAAASNEATGQGMNLGLGLAYAQTVGAAIGGMMNNMNGNANMVNQQPQGQPMPGQQPGPNMSQQMHANDCPHCGRPNPSGARFCSSCGKEIVRSLICPNCHAENPLGSTFCSKCGTRLVNEQPTSIKCPTCGADNPADAMFCPKCGTKLR